MTFHRECSRCHTRENVIETRILSSATGKEIRFRCGFIGFCWDCLQIVEEKHPEYIYDFDREKTHLTPAQLIHYMTTLSHKDTAFLALQVQQKEDINHCPVCGEKWVSQCKCPLSEHTCKNGHHWFRCPLHHTIVLGEADHSLGLNECQCHENE